MPTIEILSPLSETCVQTTFPVDGEDDLPREVKKDPKGKLVVTTGFEIRIQTRETGTTTYSGSDVATFLPDGTWTCTLTLTAGHYYDIRATLWEKGMPTAEYDEVYTIEVSSVPCIEIDPPPEATLYVAAAPAAKEFTGKSTLPAQIPGVITCVLIRYSRKRRILLPVAKYVNTGRSPSTGAWFVNQPPKMMRPKGKQKTLVLIASIDNAQGEAVATATRVIRKA